MIRMRRLGSASLVALLVLVTASIPAAVPASAQEGPVTVKPRRVLNDPNATVKDGNGKQYNLSLTVSKTTNIQPRERLKLSWSGFEPSRNYSVLDPGGNDRSELGVTILQCWGEDTKEKPLEQRQCATAAPRQLSTAVYNDTNGTGEDQNPEAPGGITGRPLGFRTVTGLNYLMKIGGGGAFDTAPADLQSSSVVPVNNLRSWTGADGKRDNVFFEVLGQQEMPSLGCSQQQKCTLVVVPILKAACARPTTGCAAAPKFPVGSGTDDGPNPYMTTGTWWLGTNWKNRLSVPITMAPPDDVCDRGDNRSPVSVAGSELDSVLMRYWVPAFCLDPKRFKLGYTRLSEPSARDQFVNKDIAGIYQQNAVLTTLPVTESQRPVVHSPVSVTGFAVTYLMDDADNKQNTRLRLTPRLLAKLLTESYALAPGHPTTGGNAVSMFTDPEFRKINPGFGFPLSTDEPKNLVLTIERTDVLWELTRYIQSDADARAWLDGAPDPDSGMVVNPLFRGQPLPIMVAERRDAWVPPAEGVNVNCKLLGVPAAANAAQPVESLERAAAAMLNLVSPATTNCVQDGDWQWKTNPRQAIGRRNLIAVTSVAFAEQYFLPTAELQVHKLSDTNRLFTAPTQQSMTAAMGYTKQDEKTGTLGLDYKLLAPNAYPGTMFTYGAVPTSGLAKPLAGNYSNFLKFAVTDGQTPGSTIGKLPPGYVPLPQVLRDYGLTAAKAVAEQKGDVPKPPPNLPDEIRDELQLPPPLSPGSSSGSGGSGAGNGGGANAAQASASASATPSAAPGSPDGNVRPATVAVTRGTDSWLAGWGLMVLLIVGGVAGLAVPVAMVAGQPGHPVRVWLARMIGRIFRRGSS
jgi:hypothetical protein